MDENKVLKDPKLIIQALDMLLKEQEDQDDNYLSAKLKVLRERVLYTHSRAEICIETLITHGVASSSDMNSFYKRISFSEKIQVSRELDCTQPSLLEDLDKLNKARNELAHPKKDKLAKYEQEKVYMETLACCIRCLMGLSVEMKRCLKETKNHLVEG